MRVGKVVNKERKLSGVQKAAVFLIAIGPEKASAVLRHMRHDRIERISNEIANTLTVDPQQISGVYNEFMVLSSVHSEASTGGIQYAKEVLDKALGLQRSDEIIRALTSHNKPFHAVRNMDSRYLVSFLDNEHPQTIALILSNLDPEQAATVLNYLPQEMQSDIAWRIATMERTSPEVVKEVEEVLEARLSGISTKDFTVVGGIDNVVSILNAVDRSTEKSIIEDMEKFDPETTEEIRKKLFVFEDIITLDDNSIRRIMREVNFKDLALALKGTNSEVSEKIFSNISQRAGEMLREDLELLGPVRVRDVEDKQQKIVQIIRGLDDAGEIILVRGGGGRNAVIT